MTHLTETEAEKVGADIAVLTLAPRSLDKLGRCCGRKPLLYKTRRGVRSAPDPHYFCARCDAEFSMDGKQRENWAYLPCDGGFTPKYPSHDYWKLASNVIRGEA